MEHDDAGTWRWIEKPPAEMNSDYVAALPKYLTAYDNLFGAAKARSEFDFVLALVHHGYSSHFDPFETTKRTIRAVSNVHGDIYGYDVEVSIGLWLYGHIVEASYPYQIIADMVGIASGQPHRYPIFSVDEGGSELSPGRKITSIEEIAQPINLKSNIKPLRDSWNADLRNAISHSNYAIVGSNLFLIAAAKTLPVTDVMRRVNRALAAFDAFVHILRRQRLQYTAPVEIPAPEYFAHEPDTKATVVVREGYGPVAIYDTVKDFNVDTPAILGRLTADETKLVYEGTFMLPASESSA